MWPEKCTSDRDDRSPEKVIKQLRFRNLGELHKEWTEIRISEMVIAHFVLFFSQKPGQCCFSFIHTIQNVINLSAINLKQNSKYINLRNGKNACQWMNIYIIILMLQR